MTVSQYFEYSFISLLCLGLLIQNYITVRRYGKSTISARFFRYFVLTMIGCSAFEVVFGLREAGLLGSSTFLAYGEEMLYTVFTVLAGYFWYFASELYQLSPMVSTRARRFLVSLPLVIMAGITIFAPLHGLNFHFENGHYVRGPLTTVFTLVMCVFIIGTGIAALVNSFNKRFYLDRAYFRVIFAYAWVLLAFQAIQLAAGPVLPFRTMGAALVIYVVQQKYITDSIYIDALTGANNRNAAERYLNRHIESNSEHVCVALIDIDRFKQINDTYGHHSGDNALKLVAKAFMTSLKDGTFFARYGGDEFLIINTSENSNAVYEIAQSARRVLGELCKKEGLGFGMDFSCGIIKKTPEMNTIPDVIKAADAEMYRIKQSKKVSRP